MSRTSLAGRVLLALIPAAALSLWSAAARAQSIPSGAGGMPAGIGGSGIGGYGRFGGPTAVSRSVTFELIERAEYDSNVARGNNALAVIRGVRKDDIYYTPSATIAAQLPFAREAFFLNGRFGYDFYQYNKVLQRENIDVTAGVGGQLGPCSGDLIGGWARHQSDLADLVATVTKNTQDQTTGGVQIMCSTGAGLGEEVAFQHVSTTNSASTGVIDADVNSVQAGVNYSNRLLGVISVTGAYSEARYGNQQNLLPNLPPLTASGFKTTAANLTYSRPIGRRLDGSLQLGYSHVEAEGGPAVQSFDGFTGRGALNYRATDRLQLSVAYQRAATPTIQQGSAYAIQENVTLDARYQLSPRLRTSLGASWAKRSFRGQAVVTPNLILDDELQAIYGSVQLTMGRHLSLAVDARQETRNTNLTLFNYSAYRVGVTATQTF